MTQEMFRPAVSATFLFEAKNLTEEFHRIDDEIARRAREIPGYLGGETWRNEASGLLAEVYYWESMDALRLLVDMDTHRIAKGRYDEWLGEYRVVISQVSAIYGNRSLGIQRPGEQAALTAPAAPATSATPAEPSPPSPAVKPRRGREAFTGLSAFPLTPLRDDRIDGAAFTALVTRLRKAGVDSITALGSTGCSPYLSREERARTIELAVAAADGLPVFAGVGALRTSHLLQNIADAEAAGADGVLVAPLSYHPLTDRDVYELFRTATEHTGLPVIVYDNPGTTRFRFSLDLYGRIAALPGIASIKIPGVPTDPGAARAHIRAIRARIPEHVTIGVSGDAVGAAGLIAGCDAFYTAIGGTLPREMLTITRAVQRGDHELALAETERLTPLWDLFREAGGSIRIAAVLSELLGFTGPNPLPLPIQGITDDLRQRAKLVIQQLGLQ